MNSVVMFVHQGFTALDEAQQDMEYHGQPTGQSGLLN